MYICACIYIKIHIYVYRYKERETERKKEKAIDKGGDTYSLVDCNGLLGSGMLTCCFAMVTGCFAMLTCCFAMVTGVCAKRLFGGIVSHLP